MTLAPETKDFVIRAANVHILPYDECCSEDIGIMQADTGVEIVEIVRYGCSGGL